MSSLTEIEAAIEALPAAEKQELLLFLAARLRAEAGAMPAPRKFSPEQISGWIAEDDEEMRQFRDGEDK
jgi:hypothetical protein